MNRSLTSLTIALGIFFGKEALVVSQEPAEAIAEKIEEMEITESDRAHWAFHRTSPSNIPPLPSSARSRGFHPIDAFVQAKLDVIGLHLAPEADRRTLIRRATYAVTGLPPSDSELEAFLHESADDAYEQLIDRLLGSPRAGEHWGQVWLDLARFAETDGFEHDRVRKDAWEYRDWVIDSLNAGLPYDRFVREQLCGDLIEGGSRIATMFGLAGPDMPDVNDQQERRHFRLNELTSTVGSVFLGLQMGCAACHDHKFDPISQADFYRLRAVFESSVGELQRDVPFNLLSENKATLPARLWIRGDHRRPGPTIHPGFPRIASTSQIEMTDPQRARQSLADWMFHEDNTLFARVAVNRVWQHYFGRGLFASASDVGVANAGPSDLLLLDWLANELRSHGWDMKQVHRTILLSATFRQISRASDDQGDWKLRLERDPSNRLWSRYPRQRLTGEMIRDSVLHFSGLLTSETRGPGVMPPLPKELIGTLLKGQWKESDREADHYRRSIYLFARRNLRYPLFEAFDRPDANASCPQRSKSTTAPQAMSLMNSEWILKGLEQGADRLMRDGTDQTVVDLLFRRAFQRDPSSTEGQAIEKFLSVRATQWRNDGDGFTEESSKRQALVDACLILANANEFIYID